MIKKRRGNCILGRIIDMFEYFFYIVKFSNVLVEDFVIGLE